jgi:hypothetical protein
MQQICSTKSKRRYAEAGTPHLGRAAQCSSRRQHNRLIAPLAASHEEHRTAAQHSTAQHRGDETRHQQPGHSTAVLRTAAWSQHSQRIVHCMLLVPLTPAMPGRCCICIQTKQQEEGYRCRHSSAAACASLHVLRAALCCMLYAAPCHPTCCVHTRVWRTNCYGRPRLACRG